MKRYVIPICKKHDRFQTEHGRWLDMKEDLQKHLEFTDSQDAILTEGECDKCPTDPNQINLLDFIAFGFQS